MKLNGQNLAIAFLAASTLGLGIQLYQTRQQLADARKAPTLQVKRSEVKVGAAPAAITAAPADNAPEVPLTPPEGDQGGGQNQRNRGPRGGFGAQMAELMKDPEFAAAMKVEQEARLDQRYGALFKQLNLSPEKLAELKSLMIERENAGRDVMASAAAQGLNPRDNRDELRKLTAEMQAEVDNNIKSTLGDSVLASINGYNSSAPQRATINDLSQKLAYSAQPLNDSQTQMLTSILAETGQASQGGQGFGRTNGVLITDATIARAQGVLMPSQVEALKKLQAEQQAQLVVQNKMRAAREQANRNNNTSRTQ